MAIIMTLVAAVIADFSTAFLAILEIFAGMEIIKPHVPVTRIALKLRFVLTALPAIQPPPIPVNQVNTAKMDTLTLHRLVFTHRTRE